MAKLTRIKYVGKLHAAPKGIGGARAIKLPADQSKPFTHPDADLILKLLPELYKKVISTQSRYRSARDGKFIKKEAARRQSGYDS